MSTCALFLALFSSRLLFLVELTKHPVSTPPPYPARSEDKIDADIARILRTRVDVRICPIRLFQRVELHPAAVVVGWFGNMLFWKSRQHRRRMLRVFLRLQATATLDDTDAHHQATVLFDASASYTRWRNSYH